MQAMRTTFITNVHLRLVSMSPKVADDSDSGSKKSIADMTHMSRRVWRMNGCDIFKLAPLLLSLSHTSLLSSRGTHCCFTAPLWPIQSSILPCRSASSHSSHHHCYQKSPVRVYGVFNGMLINI